MAIGLSAPIAGDAAGIAQRLGGGEAVAIAFGKLRGDARRAPRSAPASAAASRSASSQVRTMSRMRRLELGLLDLRRLAAGAADDEMDARQPAFRERPDNRPKAGRRRRSSDRRRSARARRNRSGRAARRRGPRRSGRTGRRAPARARAAARPAPRIASACLRSDRHGDLEQLVARIGFQHVDQRLAGMVAGIEAGLRR